ncbi:hypothetical protein ACFX16_034987 [Malus domestica]
MRYGRGATRFKQSSGPNNNTKLFSCLDGSGDFVLSGKSTKKERLRKLSTLGTAKTTSFRDCEMGCNVADRDDELLRVDLKKKMKKSRSIKLLDVESLRSSPSSKNLSQPGKPPPQPLNVPITAASPQK